MAILNKLTKKQVDNPTKKMMGDGGGLWLCSVQRKDGGFNQSWIFRYKYDGKFRDMGIGVYPDNSLKDARDSAMNWRKIVAQGKSPIEVRAQSLEKLELARHSKKTLKECVEAFFKIKSHEWQSEKHKSGWLPPLVTYAYPLIGNKLVKDVTTRDIEAVLKPIWTTKTVTAGKVRQRLHSVLDWAAVKQYRSKDNPARWQGHLDKLLPVQSKMKKEKHHAALPYSQAPELMAKINAKTSISAKALKLCILTATRTNEVIGARWDEFDLDKRLWRIPADRMKADKEHFIPLSDELVSLVQSLPKIEGSPFLFTGQSSQRHMSNMAMLRFLKEYLGYTDYTVHGFRSTFRDWAAESTSYPRAVLEHALAHQLKDDSEGAYFRSTLIEKRRALMLDWADYLGKIKVDVNVAGLDVGGR